MRRETWAAMAVLMGAGWAAAQTVAPAPATPTAPAATATTTATTAPAFDQSTPKAALKSFTVALEKGDREKVLLLLKADTETEKRLATATADLAEATAAVRRAASKAYGAETSRSLGVDVTATAEAIKRIDSAAEKIEGERATVRETNAEGPALVLVRENEKWRLPVSELSKDVEPADIEKNLADVAMQTKLLKELAGEVEAGKYKSAVEARQILDKRVIQNTMPQGGPKPATASTAPSAKP